MWVPRQVGWYYNTKKFKLRYNVHGIIFCRQIIKRWNFFSEWDPKFFGVFHIKAHIISFGSVVNVVQVIV